MSTADFFESRREIVTELAGEGSLGAVDGLMVVEDFLWHKQPTRTTLGRLLLTRDHVLTDDAQLSSPPAVRVGTLHLERVDLLRDAHVSESLNHSTTHYARHGLTQKLLYTAMAVVAAAALRLVGVAEEHGTDWAYEFWWRFREERAVETVVVQVGACVGVGHESIYFSRSSTAMLGACGGG